MQFTSPNLSGTISPILTYAPFFVKTDCTLANNEYQLFRYPKLQHDKSLQAWDSSDELAVSHIHEHCQEITDSMVIFNDSFGSLTVGLHQFNPTLITDSKVAELATLENCLHNEIASPQVLTSLAKVPEAKLYLIKLTKNLDYLDFQCQQLTAIDTDFQVIFTGKVTQVTSNVLKIIERYFDDVRTSLAKKKSRLIFANKSDKTVVTKQLSEVLIPESQVSLKAYANVFCKDQLDIGGRFLADNLPEFNQGDVVVDLGCGNGLLGVSAIYSATGQNNTLNVTFVDESYMAVESAKLNVQNNFKAQLNICHFVQNNCLEGLDLQADVILCNPPFHQQNTVTEHIAKQMFKDSYQALKKGGQLLVVANRHLAYQSQLKKIFGGFKVHNQNKKFIIYQCYK